MLERTAPRIGRNGVEYGRGQCRDCGTPIHLDAERCLACIRDVACNPDNLLSCSVPTGMAGDVYSIEEADARVTWMRKRGVTRWGDIELGPEPGTDTSDTDETQRTTPAEAAKAMRAERQRVASLASGGPVPAGARP